MDPVVPPDITADLAQILGNLMLSDNAIRSDAEKTLNDRLGQTPEIYLLGLTQLAVSAEADVIRSFSLVLLRRFLFRPTRPQGQAGAQPFATGGPSHPFVVDDDDPSQESDSPLRRFLRTTFSKRQLQFFNRPPPPPPPVVLDDLSQDSIFAIERLLLQSFCHEPAPTVRTATVEAITALVNHFTRKGRQWGALQEQALGMARGQNEALRESAFKLFARTQVLGMGGWQSDVVVGVLKGGLEDRESVAVRLAALRASSAFLLSAAADTQVASLLYPMLETLPPLPPVHFANFISSLNNLATFKPALFQPHFGPLLSFLGPRILPSTDAVSTPTDSKPSGDNTDRDRDRGDEEDKEAMMKAALEFMITLSEAQFSTVNDVDGWPAAILRGCLEGMGTLRDVEEWAEADDIDDRMNDEYARVCEHTLHRLVEVVDSPRLLPHAFTIIPAMLANYDWRLRHAGLAAVAGVIVKDHSLAIAPADLGKVIEMAAPLFNDAHPRVRYAACTLVKKLCTEVYKIAQKQYGRQLLVLLIPMFDAPEPRVQSQAATALIKLCDGISPKEIFPYLDIIVERMLRLLGPTEDGKQPKRYVQEKVISVFTAVVQVQKSQAAFAKHYSNIIPLLLNALRNSTGADSRNLRVKVLECAGFIAATVGSDIFRPDASTLAQLMTQMQGECADPMLDDQLILTWPKVCRAMRTDFEPYLAVVMPPLINVLATDEPQTTDWMSTMSRPPRKGLNNTVAHEKLQAFEALNIYSSILRDRFAPYLPRCLELTLSSLSQASFVSFRDMSISLIPLLLSCGKGSNSITAEMVSATFFQLNNLIGSEKEPTILRRLLESFTGTIKVLGGPAVVPREASDGLAESLNKQLENMANTRRNRAPIPDGPPAIDFGMSSFDIAGLQKFQSKMGILEAPTFDLASLDTDEVVEDMETMALDKIAKLLSYLDPMHPLLQKVTVVQELGRNRGIKRTDNLLKNVEALVGEFKARYSRSDEEMDCEVGDELPASLA